MLSCSSFESFCDPYLNQQMWSRCSCLLNYYSSFHVAFKRYKYLILLYNNFYTYNLESQPSKSLKSDCSMMKIIILTWLGKNCANCIIASMYDYIQASGQGDSPWVLSSERGLPFQMQSVQIITDRATCTMCDLFI